MGSLGRREWDFEEKFEDENLKENRLFKTLSTEALVGTHAGACMAP